MISPQGENLVFILSAPRSGSTLLSAMLGSHSEILSLPEPWFLLLLEQMRSPAGPMIFSESLAENATQDFLQDDLFWEAARSFAITVYNAHLRKSGKTIFVDKTPRYYHILPFIDKLFPKAKKIWLTRNPLDIAASYIKTWGISVDQILGEDPAEASFDLMFGISRLHDYFKGNNQHQLCCRYEEFVKSPESQLRAICDFLGVNFEIGQLDYLKSKWSDAAIKSPFGDKKIFDSAKIYSSSVDCWKNEISPADISRLLGAISVQLINDLGYPDVVSEAKKMGEVPHTGDHQNKTKDRLIGAWVGKRHDLLADKENQIAEKEAMIQRQAEEIESTGKRLHELDDVFHKFKLHLLVRILMKMRWLAKSVKWVMLKGASRVLKNEHEPPQAIVSKPGVARTDLKLSIVTPTFNHGKYIETTIKSVFANKYPNVEYMVMDGGSDDDTEKVVTKYKDRIARFISEKDDGQADAINKGFQYATGDIYAYINADDYYFPNAFEKVMKVFDDNPDVDVVYGHCVFVHEDGAFMNYFYEIEPFDEYRLRTCSDFIMQPATFFRKEAFEKIGGFDISLRYCFDWDVWCKMAESGLKFYLLEEPLAVNRSHPETKTNSGGWDRLREIYRTVLRHKNGLIPHAIFNYTISEVNNMDKSWYKPFLAFFVRLTCYKQILYTVRNLGSRALYGLDPSSDIVGQTAVFHLPWYGAPAKNISFAVCVPWIENGNSKMLIKLDDKVVGERCFCSNGRKMKVALDCDGQGPNHFKLELEFSRVFLWRYGAVVSDIKIT